jgi:hypothetical protein
MPIDLRKPLSSDELEVLFRTWWSSSYPGAPPGSHAVATHVAFAQWLQQQGGHGD